QASLGLATTPPGSSVTGKLSHTRPSDLTSTIEAYLKGNGKFLPATRLPPKNSQFSGLVPVDRALQTGYYLGSSG
ncbi:hypothetical protein, partial [Ferrimicrobium acidiphilum]|uniref:hypothetical protein n=1 Tax=Ferrimicrobium acidiphilum TaxID=121039 RepID=UPI0023F082DC